MIHSRWRPDVGGYDYFECSRTQNFNDDLETPVLPQAPLGAPSVECGRPIPADAVPAGEGAAAIGLVAPVDPARLVRRTRPLGFFRLPTDADPAWYQWLFPATLLSAGYIGWRLWKRRRR